MQQYLLTLFMLICSTLCAPRESFLKEKRISDLDGRIVGGIDANIEEYPYQVSVLLLASHTCGGSIISSNFVISAAHCFKFPTALYSIRAGSSYRNLGGEVIGVDSVTRHPDYNSTTVENDIAVLLLLSPLTFSASIAPIALPEQNQEIVEGVDAVVTGWGRLSEGGEIPSQLQAVIVPIVNQNECAASYATIGDVVTDVMLCAGYFEGEKDACQGDSGGPLVIDGKLIGIVSWGEGCAQENFPGVYSSVLALRSFIIEITGL